MKSTGGVCLDDGKYGQMAFRTQEKRKSGHRFAADKTLFPRRLYGGMISANLEVIWEMSVESCRLTGAVEVLFSVGERHVEGKVRMPRTIYPVIVIGILAMGMMSSNAQAAAKFEGELCQVSMQ